MTDAGLDGFLAALQRLPEYRGLVFRARPEAADFVRDNQIAVIQGPMSATRNLGVLGAASDVYAILSASGRDISVFSGNRAEGEVVFAPGTAFALLSTLEVDGRTARVVFEFTPGQQFAADEVDPFVELVRNSMTAEPVAGARAERFTGDIG